MNRLALAAAFLVAACGGGEDGPPADAGNIGVPGTYTVQGVVRYEDKPPLDTGELGPITPKLSRGISVAVIAEDDGATLAMGITGDDGTYSLEFEGVGGEPIHILAVASSTVPTRPINVRHTSAAGPGPIHGFGGPTIAAGIDTMHDVLVTVTSDEAQAFNIFDTLVDVMDRIRMSLNTPTPIPLTAFWQVGNDDGTYYFQTAMFLLGELSDDDGFDDTVIIHEAGHYVEDVIGRSDSPGGGHDGSPTNPRLAWSEGFATYFAMAVRDLPIYMDSNAGGGWAYNADTSLTKAVATGPMTQPVSEDMISEILWDMGDAPAADDDAVAGSHELVLALQNYVKTATLRPAGGGGVDLVDALDGHFNTNGLTSCTAMRSVITTVHTFPYDFAATGGSCP